MSRSNLSSPSGPLPTNIDPEIQRSLTWYRRRTGELTAKHLKAKRGFWINTVLQVAFHHEPLQHLLCALALVDEDATSPAANWQTNILHHYSLALRTMVTEAPSPEYLLCMSIVSFMLEGRRGNLEAGKIHAMGAKSIMDQHPGNDSLNDMRPHIDYGLACVVQEHSNKEYWRTPRSSKAYTCIEDAEYELATNIVHIIRVAHAKPFAIVSAWTVLEDWYKDLQAEYGAALQAPEAQEYGTHTARLSNMLNLYHAAKRVVTLIYPAAVDPSMPVHEWGPARDIASLELLQFLLGTERSDRRYRKAFLAMLQLLRSEPRRNRNTAAFDALEEKIQNF